MAARISESDSEVPGERYDPELKHVLVCADDFGLHPAVDAAIFELAASRRLGAASCLVDGPSFQESAANLPGTGLQCGLHLNFTEAMGDAAMCLPLGRLIRACWARRLDRSALRREISRQLDLYERITGRAPDYVDGHQHVHQFPQIREALIGELNRRYPPSGVRPWLRSTLPGAQPGVPLGIRAKAAIIAALGARRIRHLADREGFRSNGRFLGVYGFQGGASAYAALLRHWLAAARDGDLIMCHPALEAVPGDALAEQRRAEYETWCSDETGRLLREYGLRVTANAGFSRPAESPTRRQAPAA